jgi:hypothetical protein
MQDFHPDIVQKSIQIYPVEADINGGHDLPFEPGRSMGIQDEQLVEKKFSSTYACWMSSANRLHEQVGRQLNPSKSNMSLHRPARMIRLRS